MLEKEDTIISIELLGNFQVLLSDLNSFLLLTLLLHACIDLNKIRVEIHYARMIIGVELSDHCLCP